MNYLTVVYKLPKGYNVSEFTEHEFSSAFCWTHKMDEYINLKDELLIARKDCEIMEMKYMECRNKLDGIQDLSKSSTNCK